jgi:hypothetical protein
MAEEGTEDKYHDKPNVPIMMEMTGLSDEIVEDYLSRFDDNLERAMNGWLTDCDDTDEQTVKENKEKEIKEKKERESNEGTDILNFEGIGRRTHIKDGQRNYNNRVPVKARRGQIGEAVSNEIHVPKVSFHDRTFAAFLLISRADFFPMDVSKYIIFFILREGIWFDQFEYNFDKNGILYYLGCDEGKEADYVHPQTLGFVSCTPVNIFQGTTQQAFSHRYDPGLVQNWCYKGYNQNGPTDQTKELFMAIQFNKHSVVPTRYTIRHGYPGGHALRNWNFEGSNNGEEWFLISEHIEDESLSDASLASSASFEIPGHTESYSHFRIFVTGKSSGGSTYLMMAGFELYGCLRYEK